MRLKHELLICPLGALQVLLCMAAAIWAMTWPGLFGVYYPALAISPHSRDATTIVRWLNSSQRARSLNESVADGRLGRQELAHFSDVRRVFHWFPRVTLALAAATALFSAIVGVVLGRPGLAKAQVRAFTVWAVLIVGVGGLALWDWGRFFAMVHHPFFGDRSWRLPDDCYSLVLFPTAFWVTLTTMILLTPALVAAALLWFLRRAGSSRPLRDDNPALLTADSAVDGARDTHPPAPREKMPTTL